MKNHPVLSRIYSRFLYLLLLAALLAVPALRAADAGAASTTARSTNSGPARWEKDIAAFEAADKTNPPPAQPILFIGSSSIRMWKTLKADFPDYPVMNRGFGGSLLTDSTHFADRIVFPYQPRQIIVYAGGNDINAGRSGEDVFEAFKAFVKTVHAKMPGIRIAYISIAPNPARWKQIDRIKTANQLIEEFTRTDPKLAFINVFPQMLGPDGQPKPDIYLKDRLHMNEKGYAIWVGIVTEFLRQSK